MRYVWFFGGLFLIMAHCYVFPDESYLLPMVILYAAMIVSSKKEN